MLPLRVAAVPECMVRTDWHPTVPAQTVPLSGKAFKYALRTLRIGYLYVLLDKSVWQAYEVTAAGCMRQFHPYDMPEGDSVPPLSESCRTAGHDVITSFINLDDQRYSEAWLAFSSDPWTKTVLDGYKNALRPHNRFTKISIADLKNSPRSVPEAMVLTPDLDSLNANVAEFETTFFQDTSRTGKKVEGSIHGFYPRMDSDKQRQMGMHIIAMSEQYRCQISALVLNDSVGVVQELNNARMQIAEATQAYLEQPGIFHRHLISLAITSYMDSLKAGINANAQPEFDLKPSEYVLAGPSFGKSPIMISKEDVAKNTFAALQVRLAKSYDEQARAAFEREFEQRFSQPQALLTAVDNDLAGWYQSDEWLTVIQHDYSPDTRVHSWVAQNGTLAVCLQGGAMGAATDKVWLNWLETGTSPAYTGFTGMDPS
nr:T6SS effector BTH_I2691 family protein [uncultured Cedecea sp.]